MTCSALGSKVTVTVTLCKRVVYELFLVDDVTQINNSPRSTIAGIDAELLDRRAAYATYSDIATFLTGMRPIGYRLPMQLAEYLQLENLSPEKFARRIKVAKYSVYRYLDGRVPREYVRKRIERATKGKVPPESFLQQAA